MSLEECRGAVYAFKKLAQLPVIRPVKAEPEKKASILDRFKVRLAADRKQQKEADTHE